MALVMPGKSRCPLCHELLLAGQELVLFPHIFGPEHRFAALSDAGVHRPCLEAMPDSELALADREEALRAIHEGVSEHHKADLSPTRFDPKDLRVDIVRRSEGGRALVCGVRIWHVPSGRSAYADTGKSIADNRQLALSELEETIFG